MFCLSPAVHSRCLSRTLLLQIYKTFHLLKLWYLCKLWDLSLASNLGSTGLAGLWSVAQQLLQGIWLAWFGDLFMCFSWAHAHIPGTREPLGHWNNVNTQILEEFPAGVPHEETGNGHMAQCTCDKHNQRADAEGRAGHFISSWAHSSHHCLWKIHGGQGQSVFRKEMTSTLKTTNRTERRKQGTSNWNAHRLET